MTDAPGMSEQEKRAFLERIQDALDDLVEVTVVTAVGDLNVTIETKGGSTDTVIEKSTLKGGSLVTIVKVIDGDVTTVIGEDLLGNADVQAIHTAQVATSLEVLPTQLRNLIDIAKELRDLI